MTIMSIDASTKSTGIAIYKDKELVYYTCLTQSSTDLIKRIKKIVEGIETIAKEYKIDKVILEEVRPQNGQYGAGNIQTHRALMWLQAAIAFMLYDNFGKADIEYLYPSEWRKVCGIKQGAGVRRETLKQADINWVKEKFNITVDINDDEADSIALGYAFLNKKKELNWE